MRKMSAEPRSELGRLVAPRLATVALARVASLLRTTVSTLLTGRTLLRVAAVCHSERSSQRSNKGEPRRSRRGLTLSAAHVGLRVRVVALLLSAVVLLRRRTAVEVARRRLGRVPAKKRVSEMLVPGEEDGSPVGRDPPRGNLLAVSIDGVSTMRSSVPRSTGRGGLSVSVRSSSSSSDGSGRRS